MTARVLVVDDILANVRLLEAKLSAEYFEVMTAMNGIEALECMHRARPDIVLLDVMMPGMDGIEVCRRIKSNPKTHHIPVIMVTALDQTDDRIKGLEAGADDFLSKPLDDLACSAACAAWCASRCSPMSCARAPPAGSTSV
jgi:two-component system, cell cycle response regulator